MQYFIKRGEKVQGPFTREQVLVLVKAQKITAADLVSNSAEGPFQALKTVLESINNPPAAPASSEPVQPTIETAPQTSMPVVQESFKGSAIDTGEAAPVQSALQTGLAAAVSKAKNVAQKAAKQAKDVSQKAAKQASDLKQSTGEQFKEGGTKEAGKHLASSLADPKFRLLAAVVGIGVLLFAYMFFFSGPSISPEFAKQAEKFQRKLAVPMIPLNFISELQNLAGTSSDLPDEQRVLKIYQDSLLLWKNHFMTRSNIAKQSTVQYRLAKEYPEIVDLYDDDEDVYHIRSKCWEILWQKAEAITN